MSMRFCNQLEVKFRRKDRTEIDCLLTSSVRRDKDGAVIGYQGIIRDITQQKRMEEARRRDQQFLEAVLENIDDGIVACDSEGVLTLFNRATREFHDLPQEAMPSGEWADHYDLRYPDGTTRMREEDIPLYRAWKGEKVQDVEMVIAPEHAPARTLLASGGPLFEPDGRPLGAVVVMHDITDRKAAEEAVRQREAILRSLVDGNPESLFMMDTEGIVLIANEELARRFGTTVSEIVDSCLYDRLPPDVAHKRKEHIQEAIRTSKPVRFEDTRFGRTIDNHVQPILDRQGNVDSLVVLGIDITDLRKAEQVQRRLATAIEQSAESILITDSDGVIQYINPVVERITGFGRSEIIGNNPRIFQSGEHDSAFYEELWKTITAGEVWSGRFVNKKKDGTLYHEDATISPVRDASGKIVNFVAVKRDVTEHLELSRQLFQAQKMEAIGTLAGGVAHDFNNLLTVVMGYSELLLSEKDERDPSYEDLRKISDAAHKGADLVRRLLAFSRKSEMKPCSLNLNHQIEQLKKMLTRTVPRMIAIELNLADDLSRVNADPTQMDQVLMNLAVNAKDAMPEGGKLTIETSNVILDDEYARTLLEAKPGEYVLLSVSDTGHGMDRETLSHIFEPFYPELCGGLAIWSVLTPMRGAGIPWLTPFRCPSSAPRDPKEAKP
ncbi:MAG: PAS domain S-box protein, partial [Deltaproteobacteria bacterium]|nr:PAS domain S-box protein [Deltaproteobacteria bacterium]